jgi:hypothetical protein
VVEHDRRVEERLGQAERASGVAGEKDARGQICGGVEMDAQAGLRAARD